MFGLGLINIKDKNALLKLEKEEIIDLLISQVDSNEQMINIILKSDENGLIEYQKQLKMFKALAKFFDEKVEVQNG